MHTDHMLWLRMTLESDLTGFKKLDACKLFHLNIKKDQICTIFLQPSDRFNGIIEMSLIRFSSGTLLINPSSFDSASGSSSIAIQSICIGVNCKFYLVKRFAGFNFQLIFSGICKIKPFPEINIPDPE